MDLKVILNGTDFERKHYWKGTLTTNHSQSSYGQPVFLRLAYAEGETYIEIEPVIHSWQEILNTPGYFTPQDINEEITEDDMTFIKKYPRKFSSIFIDMFAGFPHI